MGLLGVFGGQLISKLVKLYVSKASFIILLESFSLTHFLRDKVLMVLHVQQF
jgi:hypothetical protein